MNKTDNVAY